MSGFVKLMRSDDVNAMLEKGYHNEFILLTQIALRARRTPSKIDGLAIGQAMIGDFESINLTEQKYRTAKKNLEKWGFITCKPTSKGTIATIVDSTAYDINIVECNDQPNDQPTTSQRPANDQLTTNKKERKKEVKNKPTPQPPEGECVLPDWLDREQFEDFLALRKKIKAQNTDRAIKILIAEIQKLSNSSPVLAKALIDQSIANSWKTVYPLKNPITPTPVRTPPPLLPFGVNP